MITLDLGGETRTLSSDSARKIPVLDLIMEKAPSRNFYFVDRSASLFDAVLLYSEYQICPKIEQEIWELSHYGFVVPGGDLEADVEIKSQAFVDQVLSSELPYYVSACGEIFVTTRERLKNIAFFSGLFGAGGALMQHANSGTLDDPYHLDIPPRVFGSILAHLRERKNKLSRVELQVLEPLSGLVGNTGVVRDEVVVRESQHVSFDGTGGNGLFRLCAYDASPGLSGDRTLFLPAYQRLTNFSMENLMVKMNNDTSTSLSATLPRSGDLVSNCYLNWLTENMTELCQMDPVLPFKLLKNVSLEIGGQIIQRLEGFQLYHTMTLNPKTLQHSDMRYLHLPFDFFRHVSLALSRALMYQDVRILVEVDADMIPPNVSIGAELVVRYVYLTNDEIRSRSSRQLVFPMLGCYYKTIVSCENAGSTRFTVDLSSLRYSCSMLVFSLHQDARSFSSLDSLIHYQLTVNGHVVNEGSREVALKLNKIESHLLCSSNVVTYVISFSLDPFDPIQHSGALNFNRINDVFLRVITSGGVGCVRVWGLHDNILIIRDGMAALKFSS